MIAVAAGVALCYYGHFFGVLLILPGVFLVDLYKDQAMAAALSKYRNKSK